MKRLTNNMHILLTALALTALCSFAGQAVASGVSPEIQEHFNSKVRERNKLIRQLDRLDQEALQAAEQGEPMVVIQARMQSLKDQLGTTELRLTIMSSRHNLEIPAPPQPRNTELSGNGAQVDPMGRFSRDMAPDGLARTNRIFREKALDMVRRLQFRGYPILGREVQ